MGFGGERQKEMRDRRARTNAADITLVLRPFRTTRGWVDVGGRLGGEVPVSFCSRPVRDAEFAGDQDDFMIRSVTVLAE